MAESDPFVDAIKMTGEGAESGGGDGKDLDFNTELDKAMNDMDQATAINPGGMSSPIIIQEDPSGGRVPKPAKFMPQATKSITTTPAKTPVKTSVEKKSKPKPEQPSKRHKGKGKDTDTSEGSSDDVVEETDDVIEETDDEETSTKSRKRGGNGTESGGSAKKPKRTVTEVPEEPKGVILQYNTAFYTLYDPKLRNTGIAVDAPFTTFAQYNNYTLYMNPNVTHVDQIPKSGIRLDDMTVAFFVKECGNKKLKECWPAEFDLKAMVRGRRLPLGHAAKEFKKEGEVDLDGNVLTKDQEGWYYLWLKGLHELCGQEGLDHKTYRKRPAFEKNRVPGLTWKISSPTNIQFASGDPRDHTFDRLKDYPTFKTTTVSQSDAIASSSSKTVTGNQPEGIFFP